MLWGKSPRVKLSISKLKSPRHILFISAFHTPFIQEDLDFLSKHFSVKTLIGNGVRQALKILISVRASDIVFCWFASTYSALAVLAARFLGKRSVIVIGGVDVAKEPDLNYGMFLSLWKSALVRYAIRNSDKVLLVDESLRSETISRVGYEGRNIETVPTGYDTSFWKLKGTKRTEVLCVAVAMDEKRARLKGIDILVEAARSLSRTKFTVVGVRESAVGKFNPPKNIRFIAPIEQSELLPFYQKAKVYCQPSLREGLPNTLCEAMLCQCIPVATTVGGMPEAVGNAGFLVPPKDARALLKAIQRALSASAKHGVLARKRIAENFPAAKRQVALLKILEGFQT